MNNPHAVRKDVQSCLGTELPVLHRAGVEVSLKHRRSIEGAKLKTRPTVSRNQALSWGFKLWAVSVVLAPWCSCRTVEILTATAAHIN